VGCPARGTARWRDYAGGGRMDASAVNQTRPLVGDSETRTSKGPGEATWASRRAVLASLRERFPAVLAIFSKSMPPRC